MDLLNCLYSSQNQGWNIGNMQMLRHKSSSPCWGFTVPKNTKNLLNTSPRVQDFERTKVFGSTSSIIHHRHHRHHPSSTIHHPSLVMNNHQWSIINQQHHLGISLTSSTPTCDQGSEQPSPATRFPSSQASKASLEPSPAKGAAMPVLTRQGIWPVPKPTVGVVPTREPHVLREICWITVRNDEWLDQFPFATNQSLPFSKLQLVWKICCLFLYLSVELQ